MNAMHPIETVEAVPFVPQDTDLQISLVPPQEIHRVWGKVGPMLQRSTDLSEGRYDLIDLARKLNSGEFHLWIVFEKRGEIVAAITSTFSWYPQGKFLSGQFLGGARLSEWRDPFCELFDRWGRDNDCKAVEFTGRAGWVRALKGNGYREVYRILQREL